jgi:cytochrome c oxidase cbb3-type subunit III
MSDGISLFVIIGTLGSLLAFFLLLQLNRKVSNEGKTTGHNYDGIEEYDNPLPAWWYWMFLLTILYAIGYLIYYPGLGNFEGLGGWTQVGELEKAQAESSEKYGPIFAQYRDVPLDELIEVPAAMKIGRRLYANNCAVCHGSTGTGSFGFPNLTDAEWLWGSEDADITATITNGRMAAMNPWGAILGEEGVTQATDYVMTLSGREADAESSAKGEVHFKMYCIACHGPDGKGQKMFGAPDLTNDIWLYGASRSRIQHVIDNGRNGLMPAFSHKLSADKIHILAGYVKSLSR